MLKALKRIITNPYILLMLALFTTGCDCCCECKDEKVSNLTLNISILPNYLGRSSSCPIPTLGGFCTSKGATIIPYLRNDNPDLTTEDYLVSYKYYLWVKFESCCSNFKNTEAFAKLVNKNQAYYYDPSGYSMIEYYIALAVDKAGCSQTIPFPTGGDGPSVASITVFYKEPCLSPECEDPSPCGSNNFRANYEATEPVTWDSSHPHDDISISIMLMHTNSTCSQWECQ